MTSTVTRQSELEALLYSFHLPSFTSNYQQFARNAEKEKIDHVLDFGQTVIKNFR
jgi:hypothetical protein